MATKSIPKAPAPVGATKDGKTKVISPQGKASWRKTAKGVYGVDESGMPSTKKPSLAGVKAKKTHRVHVGGKVKSGSTDTGDHHTSREE